MFSTERVGQIREIRGEGFGQKPIEGGAMFAEGKRRKECRNASLSVAKKLRGGRSWKWGVRARPTVGGACEWDDQALRLLRRAGEMSGDVQKRGGKRE